jgi:hypothetical protein
MADQKWRSRVDWQVAGYKATITRLQHEKVLEVAGYKATITRLKNEKARLQQLLEN